MTQKHYIPFEDLENRYRQVLSKKTADAFVDGRSWYEYREERFRALLASFYIVPPQLFIKELLLSYEVTLTSSLVLKPGALNLIVYLKGLGKKMLVMTRRPQNAQIRTLIAIGLLDEIDFLATSGLYGMSKTTGLFLKVIQEQKIEPQNITFVGDSIERDVKPARENGVFAIHFVEHEQSSLYAAPVKISSLS